MRQNGLIQTSNKEKSLKRLDRTCDKGISILRKYYNIYID